MRRPVAFGLLGAGAAVGWVAPALAPIAPTVAGALGVPLRLPGVDGVALTFDDGPHPQATPAVLEVLAAYDAVATFFLVGEQVQRAPSVARDILSAGHAIGVHGQRHRNQLRLTGAAVARDLEVARASIDAAVGFRPSVFRPAYGIFSAAGLRAVRAYGCRPLLWSRWGRDWSRAASVESVTELLTVDVGPGDVLLLHDADDYAHPGSWRVTLAALPAVLDVLRQRGLPTVRAA